MRYGVIGPRDFKGEPYTNNTYIYEVMDAYRTRHRITEMVSGGGKGVESFVEAWCKKSSIKCDVIMPNIKLHGMNEAFVYRNQKIIAMCDVLFIFWDGVNSHTIKPLADAMEAKKPAYVLPLI